MQPVTLAARLSGKFRSAFPDGAPKQAEDREPEEPTPEGEEPAAEDEPEHIAESREPTTIIVCADVDMLADGVAYRRVGPGLSMPLNANGDFLNPKVCFNVEADHFGGK